MKNPPRIGITMDWRESGEYSQYPWYVLRENYISQISRFGGIPVPLPHIGGLVEEYASSIDALLITGGKADVDPLLYGDTECHPSVTLMPQRTQFEMELLGVVSRQQKPALGICGGFQVMNVFRKGSLYQNLPDHFPSDVVHIQTHDRTKASHEVSVVAGTKLHDISGGKNVLHVNSVHHQGVKKLGDHLVASAFSDDGLVEAFEDVSGPFFLGLQWHPEFSVSPVDDAIFEAFVSATRGA